jgi:hypothetical protein
LNYEAGCLSGDLRNWAIRWTTAVLGLSPTIRENLEMFRVGTEGLLGINMEKQ